MRPPFIKMRHFDLFSGIGGFALAAQWMGWETVGFCEKEEYAKRVLGRHWPNVPIIDDIREIKEPIGCDIITGGFPCQPFSSAGNRRGMSDDRYLWPEMLRVIALERPAWVVGENVAGIIGMALDRTLFDLETNGYTSRAFVLPACAVGAKHRRNRVWIVAHSSVSGREKDGKSFTSARRDGVERDIGWLPEPALGRVAYGVPNRAHRIKALGNAIVPQVAFKLFQAIQHDHSNIR